jgi:hypothetical protein
VKRSRSRTFSWFVLTLFLTGAASAAPRVAVVRVPEQNDPEGLEPRLRAELEGEGFEVVLVQAEHAPTREDLEDTAKSTDSFAAIALIRPAGSLAVDVWVTDRVTGKTVLRRIDAPPESPEAGSIMAVRAVELLRASLIELNLKITPKGEIAPAPEVAHFAELPKPAPPPPPAPIPVRREAPPPVPPATQPERRFAFGLGVAGFDTPGGLGLTPGPAARLFWRPVPLFALGLEAAGPAPSTLDEVEGSASVDQELGLGVLELTPWPGSIEPRFSVGAGAYRIAARGSAAGPYAGTSTSALSFAAKVGAGARFELSRSIALGTELSAHWLAPEPVIHFSGRREASAGRPLLLGSVTLEVGW